MKKLLGISTLFFLVFAQNLSAQSWQQLPNLNQKVIAVTAHGGNVIAGLPAGLSYTTNNGASWATGSGLTDAANSFFIWNDTIFVASWEKVYKSTDLGQSWVALAHIYSNMDVNNFLISDSIFIAGLNGRNVYWSSDYGNIWWNSPTSWSSKNTALVKVGEKVYSSTRNSCRIEESDDNGMGWVTPSGNGLELPNGSWPNVLDMAALCEHTLVAGVNSAFMGGIYSGPYFSHDGGDNFVHRSAGLPDSSITCMASSGKMLFIGTETGGVHYTADEGLNWNALNSGLPSDTVNDLKVIGTTLYAAMNTGVYEVEVCSLLKNTLSLDTVGDLFLCRDSVRLFGVCGYDHVWLKDGQPIPGQNDYELLAGEPGTYSLVTNITPACGDSLGAFTVALAVDTTVNAFTDSLAANAANASYQWLDCNWFWDPVFGDTMQGFTPAQNGSFALEITQNGCTDTSSCYDVVLSDIEEYSFREALKVFPNPTPGSFSIDLGENYSEVRITITDLRGRIVYERRQAGMRRTQIDLDREPGLYFVEIRTKGGMKTVVKLILS